MTLQCVQFVYWSDVLLYLGGRSTSVLDLQITLQINILHVDTNTAERDT
jgi:hypothetical protein